MSEELVTVRTFRFLPEAEAAKLHLEAEGHTVFLADAEIVNMDWLLGNAVGNIKLQVPLPEADAALALLEAQDEQRAARREDDEESEVMRCLGCGEDMFADEAKCPSCGWSYEGGEKD